MLVVAYIVFTVAIFSFLRRFLFEFPPKFYSVYGLFTARFSDLPLNIEQKTGSISCHNQIKLDENQTKF